jgi:hypothetical protein
MSGIWRGYITYREGYVKCMKGICQAYGGDMSGIRMGYVRYSK